MRRVIAPLTRMGARIDAVDGRLPMTIRGGSLTAIEHETEVPSAQVKSAVLLAGLLAEGHDARHRSAPRRGTTPSWRCGVRRRRGASPDRSASIEGGQDLAPAELTVPGDLSSAAFWCSRLPACPGRRSASPASA